MVEMGRSLVGHLLVGIPLLKSEDGFLPSTYGLGVGSPHSVGPQGK